jgi:hypothetical protein
MAAAAADLEARRRGEVTAEPASVPADASRPLRRRSRPPGGRLRPLGAAPPLSRSRSVGHDTSLAWALGIAAVLVIVLLGASNLSLAPSWMPRRRISSRSRRSSMRLGSQVPSRP